MERFEIGTCRSGAVVTSSPYQDEYRSDEDLFDAMAIVEAFVLRERRLRVRNSESLDLERLVQQVSSHLLQKESMSMLKWRAGIRTAFELVQYGQNLLRVEFRS